MIDRIGCYETEYTSDNWGSKCPETTIWNGRKVNLLEENADLLQKISQKTKGSIGGSATGKTDVEGNTSVEAEGHVSSNDADGGKVEARVEGSVNRDSDGKVTGEASVKISYEREFSILKTR